MDVLPAQIAKAQSIMSVSQSAWDSERWMDRSVLDERPILPLVEAFLVDSDLGRRKLTWLCLYAARRALPAWKLYCDGERPRLALDALTEYLRDGVPCDPNFAVAEPPAIHGSPIVDCLPVCTEVTHPFALKLTTLAERNWLGRSVSDASAESSKLSL